MTVHQFLFPNCHQHGRIVELEAANKSLQAELKREVTRNRKREDALLDRILTKNGQFAIGAREVEPPVEPQQQIEAAPVAEYDEAKEQQITKLVDELDANYTQRGHRVPKADIRKKVEQNFVYLTDDERMEIEN